MLSARHRPQTIGQETTIGSYIDLQYHKHQEAFTTRDSIPAKGLIGLDSNLVVVIGKVKHQPKGAAISYKLPNHQNLSGFESLT